MNTHIRIQKALINGTWVKDLVFTINNGRIVTISPFSEAVTVDEYVQGKVLPGYIDTQVNGGGGVMFNHVPTLDSIALMADAHLQYGTTGFFPTLITDDLTTIEAAANAVAEAKREQHPSVLGVHFEGPHLSVAKKGVHLPRFIRPLSDKEFAVYTRKDIGQVIVTVAPENVSADVISALVKEGVIVALGHSNAPHDIVQKALEAGATGFTHLLNAMSPFTSREPGMVGEALLSNATCGLIVDHQHLHKKSAELAIKVKGEKQIMLVTDAMAHVGAAQDTVAFFDTEITRSGQKLTTPDGTLAGSCLDMHQAVLNCVNDISIPLEKASVMASQTPAAFANVSDAVGQLAVGYAANFVVLDDDNALNQVWQNGVCKKDNNKASDSL
ncbi:N-acetylglucosamine-6-phosphate deacetylase [Alteromonas sp. A079]|uniref:N-acetylglucosamine-6-phosphate deacetylase n=1 Tax=Alteromonas sp. A079 TaxID=3410268 RepID=UPI003BA2E95D